MLKRSKQGVLIRRPNVQRLRLHILNANRHAEVDARIRRMAHHNRISRGNHAKFASVYFYGQKNLCMFIGLDRNYSKLSIFVKFF